MFFNENNIEVIKRNIKDLDGQHCYCITTNGSIKKVKNYNELVMGRGIALAAKQLHPELPKLLASYVSQIGNHVYYISELNLFSFPVKHHWSEKADIELIKRSCIELLWYIKFGLSNQLITMFSEKQIIITEENPVYLPKPGCNNGQLKWEDVEREIEPIIKDYPIKIFEL